MNKQILLLTLSCSLMTSMAQVIASQPQTPEKESKKLTMPIVLNALKIAGGTIILTASTIATIFASSDIKTLHSDGYHAIQETGFKKNKLGILGLASYDITLGAAFLAGLGLIGHGSYGMYKTFRK